MEFLLDSNFGLPVSEKPWSDILSSAGIVATATNDLARIERSVERHQPDIAYLPLSAFHRQRARGDTHYRGFVIVTSKLTGRITLPSVLVVAADDPAHGIDDLRRATLGYINRSCSSSYFCPAILLSERGEDFADFFDLIPTEPWQGQIDAVISGAVRATMVLEDVWKATPANAVETRIVGRYDKAAGGVIVVRGTLVETVQTTLLDALLTWRPSPADLYGPFTRYREDDVAPFFRDMERLPAGF